MSNQMIRNTLVTALFAGCAIALALTQTPPRGGDGGQERQITEAEVPRAALDALKKLAGGAQFTAFAEEIEHGHTFYEGSWKGPNGNIDALVTETGDLVEIEEMIPLEQVPSAARATAEHAAGKGAKMTFEKKTLVMYEVHYQKDGKGREMILTPDGRQHREEGGDEDEGDDEGEDQRR